MKLPTATVMTPTSSVSASQVRHLRRKLSAAAVRPASLAELGRIGGVGAKKLEAFGDAFLEVMRQEG